MNKFLKIGTAAILGAMAFGSSADAALTTPETLNFSFGSLSGSQNLTFNGFNTGLGTLVEVLFSFSAAVELTNTAAVVTGTSDHAVGSPTALSASATISATLLTATASASLSTPGFTGTVTFPGINTVGTASDTIADSDSITNIFLLPAFTGGPASVSMTVSSTGSLSGSVPSQVFLSNAGSSVGTATIQYRYNEPVISTPEPASMVLVGAGLLGLGLARRRRA